MLEELTQLSDRELTLEADRAGQQSDSSRVSLIKAEKARRAIASTKERATNEVLQGAMASCLFTAWTFFVIAMSVFQTGRLTNFVFLPITVIFAFLTRYIFKGNLSAAIVALMFALGITFGNFFYIVHLDKKPNVIATGVGILLACGIFLAVRGAFALYKFKVGVSIFEANKQA